MPVNSNDSAQTLDATTAKWYLVQVAPKRRELFCRHLETRLEQDEAMRSLILRVEQCPRSEYEDFVLMQLASVPDTRRFISQTEYYSKLQPKPLTAQEAKIMLGQ